MKVKNGLDTRARKEEIVQEGVKVPNMFSLIFLVKGKHIIIRSV